MTSSAADTSDHVTRCDMSTLRLNEDTTSSDECSVGHVMGVGVASQSESDIHVDAQAVACSPDSENNDDISRSELICVESQSSSDSAAIPSDHGAICDEIQSSLAQASANDAAASNDETKPETVLKWDDGVRSSVSASECAISFTNNIVFDLDVD